LPSITPDIVKSFAPTGTLRAAINTGNPVLVQGSAAAPTGVTVDLATELAKRLGVPLKLVPFAQAGGVFEALQQGLWDIAFLAIEPKRAAEIDFTAPYVIIEGVYVVPKESKLQTVEQVDSAGVRISVITNAAYDLFLTRSLKNAQLVRTPNSGFDQFEREKLDVIAGVKQPMAAYVARTPAVRMIPGRFMEIRQAMGTPKGRDAAAAYLRGFVEEMKASGFVGDSLKRAGQGDATVAPAE
jgi:polar amino acid transport system substrate-binding protein